MTNQPISAATAIAATITARYAGLKFAPIDRPAHRTGKVRTARHAKRRALR